MPGEMLLSRVRAQVRVEQEWMETEGLDGREIYVEETSRRSKTAIRKGGVLAFDGKKLHVLADGQKMTLMGFCRCVARSCVQ